MVAEMALGATAAGLRAGVAEVAKEGAEQTATQGTKAAADSARKKTWQEFLPEAQKRLAATKKRLGNPSDEIVNMAMPRKKALERIENLTPELEKHLEKIVSQPGSRDVSHWRTEARGWIKAIEAVAPDTGKKTSAELATKIAQWKRRLGE